MRKTNLKPTDIDKIIKIFNKKNWDITNSDLSLLTRYCERFSFLATEDKQKLMKELTEDYLWIKEEDYINELITLLNQLFNKNIINNNQCSLVVPIDFFRDDKNFNIKSSNSLAYALVVPIDFFRDDKNFNIKSSNSLAYVFKSTTLKYSIDTTKFILASNLKQIKSFSSKILLVDDYIGSGHTLDKSISKLLTLNININNVVVMCLVCQKDGKSYIKRKYNIDIFSNYVVKKGISDKYTGSQLNKNSKIMQDIEQKLKINNKFSFGYNSSESLVTVARTPNNTFPLFWYENENSKAPFPR